MRKKSNLRGMRLGQTIVAEREYAETDSERMLARKKVHRKQRTSVVIVLLMLVLLGLMAYLGIREAARERTAGKDADPEVTVRAEIFDENGAEQIATRVYTYISQLEGEFRARGYTVTKVVLPRGLSRALYVDLAGQTGYFKVNLDRDVTETAEDAVRMMKYIREKDLTPEYVDVRVEGKAFYK